MGAIIYYTIRELRKGVYMKLIFAIVHDEDGPKVMDELNSKGFSVTKLCSSGGFLKSGNTTLLIGVDEEKVKLVLDIIGSKSKSRKHGIKSAGPAANAGAVAFLDSKEVVVGGATVFIMDVERFEKV